VARPALEEFRTMSRSRFAAVIAAAIVVSVALVGCTQAAPKAHSTAKSSTASATPTPTATPDPTFVADGTAQQNKAYFDFVNNRLFASNGSALGKDIIDNLVAAGFTKADMQVTPDKTSIGVGADSILFSVRIGNECLLGQHGGSGYSSDLAAALANNVCLIGLTRPINW
jgi:hypothetical protein